MDWKRIAHRGFSSEAPENTRAAFALAVEGDFFGVECDIWKCKDGTYVVSHDGHLRRMCGVNRWIPEMTWEEVKSCPITAGKKIACYAQQYLSSFSEYLAIMARSQTIHPVVELKMDYTTVELKEIIELVCDYGLYDYTYFISMHPLVLLRLRDLEFPGERLQYVYGAAAGNKWTPVSQELTDWLVNHRISLDTRYTLISEEFVRQLKRAGLCVNVWTVNDKEQASFLVKEVGVDMVTTEYFFDL